MRHIDEDAVTIRGHGSVVVSHYVSTDLSDHFQLEEWLREFLELRGDEALSMIELRCPDPQCPLIETVISLFRPGEVLSLKVARPRKQISRADFLLSFRRQKPVWESTNGRQASLL